MKCRSEWQRPATEVRIRTSRGPGLGRLTSSMTRGLLTSCRPAAFIVIPHSVVVRCFHLPGGGVRKSLRRRDQFANLGHAGRSIAEQKPGDGILRPVFREPE